MPDRGRRSAAGWAGGGSAGPETTGNGLNLQIAPPGGGVAAYAECLARHMPDSRVQLLSDHGRVHAAVSAARPRSLLLQYAGYGFQPRGVPSGILSAVDSLRAAAPDCKIGIFFHEVHAFGPPWRSSFWLMPIQRSLARRLLEHSDAAATSLPRYKQRLGSARHGSHVEVLPIPSTVGEPKNVADWQTRPRRLVVFGGEGVRSRAWSAERAALESSLSVIEVDEIVDIGPGDVAPDRIGGVRVVARGAIEPSEVSRELAGSRFGFIAYPPDYLDKSTVFASYLAHGLAPLVAWSGLRGRGPEAGETWLRAGKGIGNDEVLAKVASHSAAAYEPRSLARHVRFWIRSLAGA